MIRIGKAVVFLIVMTLAMPASASAALTFGPYLQSMAPDRIKVCAWFDAGDKASVTLIEASGQEKTIGLEGSHPGCATLTGLTAEVEHRYQFTFNGKAQFAEPTPFLAASNTDASIAIYGDTRSGDDSFDLAHRQIVKAIRETAVPDAIIHTGDYVEKGGDFRLWTNFFLIEKNLLPSTPIYPSIGRSDQPPDLMRQLFPRITENPYYSFDRANAHFVVLFQWHAAQMDDSYTTTDGEQARWLREDLGRARKSGATHIFVISHEPPVDLAGIATKAFREVYEPIFKAFNVTAVFSGAHYFSHRVSGGVHYFTNGGGGALLDTQPPKEGLFRYHSAIHHFLILETGQSGTRVRAVNGLGEDFYEVSFDRKDIGSPLQSAPTYVHSYNGGDKSVPFTVYFRPGCSDCKEFEADLERRAQSMQANLVVTFKNLDNADNTASLAALSDLDGPTPIVVIAGQVLVGSDQVDALLDDEIKTAAKESGEQRGVSPPVIILIIVLGAGLVLLVTIILLLKGRKKHA